VRPRDPRRLLARRRDERARVRIGRPRSAHDADGSVTSVETAEVTLPRSELERIWVPEYLERLARSYWRFLTRVSLGLLRVLYTPSSREVVVLTRPFVLLRFLSPEYDVRPHRGSVTWPIERGLLVARRGRGRGYLRLTVALDPENAPEATVTVTSEVANFYPRIAGSGWFARIGRVVYGFTQLRLHVIVTHAFLRSLARLDLERSLVGALAPPAADAASPGGSRAASSGRALP
jgi:hypothetical protein